MRIRLSVSAAFLSACICSYPAVHPDSVSSGFSRMPEWHVGIDVNPGWVAPTNKFLRGNNKGLEKIDRSFSGDVRAGFRFSPGTREGLLYNGLYQGVGVGVSSFSGSALGSPVSVYVFQGAPVVHFTRRLWLGYEWRFGSALGWHHYDAAQMYPNLSVSTSATAMLGLGLKVCYDLTDRWQLSAGVNATHYSNGNTSLPNSGVNTVGVSVGVSYVINPQPEPETAPEWLVAEADRGRWLYDIMTYGAWRRHTATVEESPQLCPGRFGIVGLQLMPLRKFNRWFAAGPSLDLQWDEGAGLEPYWIPGTSGDGILFSRPPFGKQISVGVSAHAELTMPIFTVDAGVGYDFVSPHGARRFYQSLTLKTFLTRRLYLNVGYRLGNFKDPQNLMLGVGVRL